MNTATVAKVFFLHNIVCTLHMSPTNIPSSSRVAIGRCFNLQVYLFGGAVCSWKQATGDEVLFVRPDAVFDKSKPISGGVPHCFPQFGPGAMQQHGFARNLDWEVRARGRITAGRSNDDSSAAPAVVAAPHSLLRQCICCWPSLCCVCQAICEKVVQCLPNDGQPTSVCPVNHFTTTAVCVQVASTSADYQPDERDPEVELVLTENDYTLKMWPYKFKAVRAMFHHSSLVFSTIRGLLCDTELMQ